MEHGVCDLLVGVLEERDVDQTGAVFQRYEDDPLPGRDGWGLGGGAHPGNEDLLAGDHAAQVCGIRSAELSEQPEVVLHQVVGDVDLECLQFCAEICPGWSSRAGR